MKKRHKVALVVAIVIAIGGAAIDLARQSKEAEPNTAQTKPGVKGVTTEVATKTIANTYFEAKVPGRFQPKQTTAKPVFPIMFQQLYAVNVTSAVNISSDQLAITVGDLQAGGLKDVSAVQMRSRDSGYNTLDVGQANENHMAFISDIGGTEVSLFTARDNLYAAFVLTSQTAVNDTLISEIKAIAESITWQ